MIKKQKKVVFYELEHKYANLKIRLKFDSLKQGDFFRMCIDKYIGNDEDMLRAVDKFKIQEGRISAARQKMLSKDRTKAKDLLANLGLDDGDRQEIFDIIEGTSGGDLE